MSEVCFCTCMNHWERFLKACRREPVDRPPVWLMRQAGRYLPEYQKLRKRYGFLELAKDPSSIVEISLQPWRRFGIDAVIVFSDILLPVEAMGVGLLFREGEGPRFRFLIQTKSDLEKLNEVKVGKDLSFVYDGLRQLKEELGDQAALIGFVGGPWTMAKYMMEDAKSDFELSLDLMKRVTNVLCEHAVAQVRAGADVIQIFETWGSLLDPLEYGEKVLPLARRIVNAVKEEGGLSVFFVKESRNFFDVIKASGADVASIGCDIKLSEAFEHLSDEMAIQGNLDPNILLGDENTVRRETQKLIEEVNGRAGWIANLGHGVLPKTPVKNVQMFLEMVKSCRFRSTPSVAKGSGGISFYETT